MPYMALLLLGRDGHGFGHRGTLFRLLPLCAVLWSFSRARMLRRQSCPVSIACHFPRPCSGKPEDLKEGL